jgi:hypothetical protein
LVTEIHTASTSRKYRFFNKTTVTFPDGSTLPHGHRDVEAKRKFWEENTFEIEEMLRAAESDLEASCDAIEGYDFDFSEGLKPAWLNPDHPEHKARIGPYNAREEKRAAEVNERELKIQSEIREEEERDEMIRQMEYEDEMEAERLNAMYDEADAAEQDLEGGGWDDRGEEDLDPEDDGMDYGVDQEPEVENEFIEMESTETD